MPSSGAILLMSLSYGLSIFWMMSTIRRQDISHRALIGFSRPTCVTIVIVVVYRPTIVMVTNAKILCWVFIIGNKPSISKLKHLISCMDETNLFRLNTSLNISWVCFLAMNISRSRISKPIQAHKFSHRDASYLMIWFLQRIIRMVIHIFGGVLLIIFFLWLIGKEYLLKLGFMVHIPR